MSRIQATSYQNIFRVFGALLHGRHWAARKETCLKVAIAGRSGTGKSTFINAIRGITDDDEDKDPAMVGVTETTYVIREYKFPGNDKIVLVDLPGLGTPSFRKNTYMSDINVHDYDIFIIMSKDRLFDDDMWLAQQLLSLKKIIFFVRSNIANDIRNDIYSHPRTHNEDEVLRKIKRDITETLETNGLYVNNVFLIDSYKTNLYDFGKLAKKLEDLPNGQRMK